MSTLLTGFGSSSSPSSSSSSSSSDHHYQTPSSTHYRHHHSSLPSSVFLPNPTQIPQSTSIDKLIRWKSIYSIRQTRTWSTLLEIGSLSYLSLSPTASLERRRQQQTFISSNLSFTNIPSDLIENAAQGLTWVWELSECQIAIKLLADRLSDCWFGGLPHLISAQTTKADTCEWILSLVEALDFLTRTLQTYDTFNHTCYIFQALPAFHTIYNYNHGEFPSPPHSLQSQQWNHIRSLIVQILYRIYPESIYRSLALHAIPRDDIPIYASSSLRKLLVAILHDYWKPVANLSENPSSHLFNFRSTHRLSASMPHLSGDQTAPNFGGDRSTPTRQSISYLADLPTDQVNDSASEEPMHLEDFLLSQAWSESFNFTSDTASSSIVQLIDPPALHDPHHLTQPVDKAAFDRAINQLLNPLMPPPRTLTTTSLTQPTQANTSTLPPSENSLVSHPPESSDAPRDFSRYLEGPLPPIEFETRAPLAAISEPDPATNPAPDLDADLDAPPIPADEDELHSNRSTADSSMEAAEVTLLLTSCPSSAEPTAPPPDPESTLPAIKPDISPRRSPAGQSTSLPSTDVIHPPENDVPQASPLTSLTGLPHCLETTDPDTGNEAKSPILAQETPITTLNDDKLADEPSPVVQKKEIAVSRPKRKRPLPEPAQLEAQVAPATRLRGRKNPVKDVSQSDSQSTIGTLNPTAAEEKLTNVRSTRSVRPARKTSAPSEPASLKRPRASAKEPVSDSAPRISSQSDAIAAKPTAGKTKSIPTRALRKRTAPTAELAEKVKPAIKKKYDQSKKITTVASSKPSGLQSNVGRTSRKRKQDTKSTTDKFAPSKSKLSKETSKINPLPTKIQRKTKVSRAQTRGVVDQAPNEEIVLRAKRSRQSALETTIEVFGSSSRPPTRQNTRSRSKKTDAHQPAQRQSRSTSKRSLSKKN